MTPQRANFRIIAGPKPAADRLAELNEQASRIASEHISELIEAIEHTGLLANSIANGGDCYSVGTREVARSLTFRLSSDLLNLKALQERK